MRISVTGSNGFLGWHLKCANKAFYNHEIVEVLPPYLLEGHIRDEANAIIHLASKMRGSEIEIAKSNRDLTKQLLTGLEKITPGIFVHANSIHSGDSSAFGQSKAEMAQMIDQKCKELGWKYFDVKFPNIFGERARPFHNSFIATVITSLQENREYDVLDNPIDLVSAHDAAKCLLDICSEETFKDFDVEKTTVGMVVNKLEMFHATYRNELIPELENLFDLKLFNAYRFNLGPMSVKLNSREDPRGRLVELANFLGSSNTVFASETKPGYSRGHHFHINKFERFIILSGSGVIEVEELFSKKSFRFEVDGKNPCAVDIPTLSAHKLINTGSDKLFGIFMAIPKFDPEMMDTYPVEF